MRAVAQGRAEDPAEHHGAIQEQEARQMNPNVCDQAMATTLATDLTPSMNARSGWCCLPQIGQLALPLS